MNFRDFIVRDPAICGGEAVFKGTRVLLRTVLGYLAHGESTEVVRSDFPSLTEDHVRAAIAFAASVASEDLPMPSMPSDGIRI